MWKGILLSLISLLLTINGMGHPMPHSILVLDVKEDHIYAELKIPLKELQFAVPFDLTELTEPLLKDERRRQLLDYLRIHIRPKSLNGLDWAVEVLDMSLEETEQEATGKFKELAVKLLMKPPSGESLRNFKLYYDAVLHQVVTHKVFVSLREDWQNGRTGDKERNLGVIELNIAQNSIEPMPINLDEGSRWKGFWSMFSLGMNHIRGGTDHILFLITLLLIAPLKIEDKKWSLFQGWKYGINRFLKISIAFTIGHSAALLLGAIELIDYNVQLIETLIAFSILLSAVNCIYPIFKLKESWVALGFGCIHGVAFSGAISSLNLSVANKALSILGFNLGIEAMQVLIMLICFPVLFLSKWKIFNYWRILIAIFTSIAAVIWMVERITGNTIISYVIATT